MSTAPATRIVWLLMAAALLCGAGCGAQGRSVYPVAGTLLVDGAPAAGASLAFHPISDGVKVCPVGITGPEGSFLLSTYSAADGAPPGEYIVTVLWPDPSIEFDECDCPDPSQHDLLGGIYCHRALSTLRATVHAAQNTITLRTEKPASGMKRGPSVVELMSDE